MDRTDFSREIPPGWFPWKIIADKKLLRWVYLGNEPFTESFFSDTISARLHLKENSRPSENSSSIENFLRASAKLPAIEPAAFIFHVSRCGSTLLTQLLATDPQITALSEVPALDESFAFARANSFSPAETKTLLRSMINVLGRTEPAMEKQVFVKLDSWHIFYHALIREIYPRVPFVLLYRSPDEVLQSHRRRAGMHMTGMVDPTLFGMQPGAQPDPQLFMREVLERYLQEFIRVAEKDPLAQLANYNEGMGTIAQRLLREAGIFAGEEIMQQMTSRLLFHSKNPGEKFTGDPEAEAVTAISGDLREAYRRLEKLRPERSRFDSSAAS